MHFALTMLGVFWLKTWILESPDIVLGLIWERLRGILGKRVDFGIIRTKGTHCCMIGWFCDLSGGKSYIVLNLKNIYKMSSIVPRALTK